MQLCLAALKKLLVPAPDVNKHFLRQSVTTVINRLDYECQPVFYYSTASTIPVRNDCQSMVPLGEHPVRTITSSFEGRMKMRCPS